MTEAGMRGAAGDTRCGGSCHPETPETCLAKATGGRIQAWISTDQGPQVLRGWEPFLGGGESPRGSAAPLGTRARKRVTAAPESLGPGTPRPRTPQGRAQAGRQQSIGLGESQTRAHGGGSTPTSGLGPGDRAAPAAPAPARWALRTPEPCLSSWNTDSWENGPFPWR